MTLSGESDRSWCYCPNAGGYRHEPTDICRLDTPTAIYPDRYVTQQQAVKVKRADS